MKSICFFIFAVYNTQFKMIHPIQQYLAAVAVQFFINFPENLEKVKNDYKVASGAWLNLHFMHQVTKESMVNVVCRSFCCLGTRQGVLDIFYNNTSI